VDFVLGWCENVRSVETELVDAAMKSEGEVPPALRLRLTTSAMKQNLTCLIRGRLRTSSLELRPIFSGNPDAEYLHWPGVAVVRVKGLNRDGRPSNYPTETSLAYHLGGEVESLPDLPQLPRVDYSYHLDPVTNTITRLEMLEWFEETAIRRYQLPLNGDARVIEVAPEIPFTHRPPVVRPSRAAEHRRGKRKDEKDGTDS
jgi:hypothetical protein